MVAKSPADRFLNREPCQDNPGHQQKLNWHVGCVNWEDRAILGGKWFNDEMKATTMRKKRSALTRSQSSNPRLISTNCQKKALNVLPAPLENEHLNYMRNGSLSRTFLEQNSFSNKPLILLELIL